LIDSDEAFRMDVEAAVKAPRMIGDMPDGRIALLLRRDCRDGYRQVPVRGGNQSFHALRVHGCVLVVRHELLPKADETVILHDLLLDPCVLIAEDD
jgi:hypothetical protein